MFRSVCFGSRFSHEMVWILLSGDVHQVGCLGFHGSFGSGFVLGFGSNPVDSVNTRVNSGQQRVNIVRSQRLVNRNFGLRFGISGQPGSNSVRLSLTRSNSARLGSSRLNSVNKS
ncbi:hypothetical protein HanPI659440_Chr17g0692221 [Helianthus annuus]|uniref:Uncharacterized protein n=1 Tax=Helianthus annuus TaxID=4232 RepID=A0A9K3DKC0_HELAN|nr:hypothetical protein HanXRQr2_Chr17g0817291 [Helianthus annuus]KAJ0668674.1 hypothetical protein HanPI659440_Chr17g0692221 [Helianthus annuus]